MTAQTLRPEQLLSVARAFRPTPSRTGALYLASDLAGLSQTFRQAAADRFPVRLAPSQDRTLPIAETPLGLLVRQDRGGNETWQLAMLDPAGRARPLTSDARAIHRDVTVTPDGRRAGLAYNPGGQADWVLAVIDLETGDIERWIDRGGYWSWLAWHPDGRTAAVARASETRPLANAAFLVERDGEPRPLLGAARLVADVVWAGGRLYALTDLDRDFVGLVEVDAEDPARIRRRLVDEEHDVRCIIPSPHGRLAAVVVDEGPYDAIRVLDLETAEDHTAAWAGQLPRGLVYIDNATGPRDHVAWSRDGERLFVAWESATRPAEIYELPSGARWTAASGEPLAGLIEPEQVGYRSFDGLEVRALHFRVDGSPRPTVVWFHGGPAGHTRANFIPIVAMWNAAGYDVFAPNVRGSTGRGQGYAALDDRELRWDSVRDGCEAGRWLRREGLATHLVAMGGSYGGFMTLAVLVEDPELWDAGVDTVGIADWHSFFENISGWRRTMRTVEYGDPAGPDGEFLAEFSPLRRAHRIKAPLLVIHGRNDVRVPVEEAVLIHGAAPGSELLIFDDEGHGIQKHGNRSRAYGRALAFVGERLRV